MRRADLSSDAARNVHSRLISQVATSAIANDANRAGKGGQPSPCANASSSMESTAKPTAPATRKQRNSADAKCIGVTAVRNLFTFGGCCGPRLVKVLATRHSLLQSYRQ